MIKVKEARLLSVLRRLAEMNLVYPCVKSRKEPGRVELKWREEFLFRNNFACRSLAWDLISLVKSIGASGSNGTKRFFFRPGKGKATV